MQCSATMNVQVFLLVTIIVDTGGCPAVSTFYVNKFNLRRNNIYTKYCFGLLNDCLKLLYEENKNIVTLFHKFNIKFQFVLASLTYPIQQYLTFTLIEKFPIPLHCLFRFTDP